MTTPDLTQPRAERRLLTCLCLVLALLQVLDLHSTLRAAGAGRSETNPMILWMTSHVGFTAAVTACKAAALAIIGSYYAAVSNFNRMRWPAIALIPVCVIYLAVVLNNYS